LLINAKRVVTGLVQEFGHLGGEVLVGLESHHTASSKVTTRPDARSEAYRIAARISSGCRVE
jgi:hypothetical protein